MSEHCCDTLLKARYCVTQDKDRTVFENAAIAIADGRIAAIGRAEDLQEWHAREMRDLGNALVMPGMVNAHTHVAMTFLRGLGDDMPLMEWLEKRIFPVETRLTAEIVYTASLMGFAEMLASGTTACLDMYYFLHDILKAAQTAGIRCMAGEPLLFFPDAACKTWQEALAVNEGIMDRLSRYGHAMLVANPHSVYTSTPEILSACRDFAARHDIPLHIHLSETTDETIRCMAKHGKRPVAYCNELGLLDLPVTLAHVVDVTEEELDLLASKPDLVVAHNPSSNMKLASGAAPVPAMLERGIRVCLGTDGAASNNGLNMFTEMRHCALMHKLTRLSPTVAPAQAVLDMATCHGVACLHDKVLTGALSVGSPADLTVLDLDRPHMQPMYSPASHLVYAATGGEVVLTMIAGTIAYDNGQFTLFDYAALCGEMEKLRQYTRTLVA